MRDIIIMQDTLTTIVIIVLLPTVVLTLGAAGICASDLVSGIRRIISRETGLTLALVLVAPMLGLLLFGLITWELLLAADQVAGLSHQEMTVTRSDPGAGR